jgi:hypothetical protein
MDGWRPPEKKVKHILNAIDRVKPKMALGGMNTECATGCNLNDDQERNRTMKVHLPGMTELTAANVPLVITKY